MACPFFFPEERHEAELWAFRARLPLGDGFRGRCMAPGCDGRAASDDELKDFCNVGYAQGCACRPHEREADAVHFAAVENGSVRVRFAFVKDQAPAGHGVLEFDAEARKWMSTHPSATVQRMAECYVEAWLKRRGRA